jgi:hypothetical protein
MPFVEVAFPSRGHGSLQGKKRTPQDPGTKHRNLGHPNNSTRAMCASDRIPPISISSKFEAIRPGHPAITAQRGRHCHRMDFQPLGCSRTPKRFLPGRSVRTFGGAVGSHILSSNSDRAAAPNYARTRFPDSSATSASTRNARKPAPGIIGQTLRSRLPGTRARPADKKDGAFRRLFSDLGAGLFREASTDD